MKSLALGAVVIAVLGLVTEGSADNLTIMLTDGVTTVFCADQAACDAAGALGVVTFSTGFGAVTVGGAGGGAPALGTYDLDLSYFLFGTAGAPGVFTVAVSENNLSGSNLLWSVNVDGNQTNGAATEYALFGDLNNALFTGGLGGNPLCSVPATGGTSVHVTCSSGSPFGDAQFSLSQFIYIHHYNSGLTSVTGDALAQTVPEPGSLFLLGSALAGIGVLRRRWGKPAA